MEALASILCDLRKKSYQNLYVPLPVRSHPAIPIHLDLSPAVSVDSEQQSINSDARKTLNYHSKLATRRRSASKVKPLVKKKRRSKTKKNNNEQIEEIAGTLTTDKLRRRRRVTGSL